MVEKQRNKTLRITYKCVGNKEENQEKLDRVFDILFDEVLKTWKNKSVDKKVDTEFNFM